MKKAKRSKNVKETQASTSVKMNSELLGNGHTNGKKELTLDSLIFDDIKAAKQEIENKAGKRPEFPRGLAKGKWTEQSLKVLEERYLMKDMDGKVVETPDEMCWRVAWDIASAETQWGGKRSDVIATAKEFFNLLVTHEFLPNSPTL